MPKLNLSDKNQRNLQLVGIDGLPPNVAAMTISSSGPQTDVSCTTLMKVLEALPAKLKKIGITGLSDINSSPEYLDILTACFTKTECLYLYDMSHPEEFEHIVSGLSQPNGLKELHLKKIPFGPPSMRESGVSNDNLRMLLRGLSSSSSLEKLRLEACNSLDEDDLGNELISAIRGIRMLKILNLDLCWGAEHHRLLQAVLRAAILEKQVKDFCLVDNFGGGRDLVFQDEVWVETFRNPRCVLETLRLYIGFTEENRLPLQRIFCSAIVDAKIKELVLCKISVRDPLMIDHDVWVNALCHQNCVLEKLHLHGIKLNNSEESSEGISNGPELTAKNSSVKDLQIMWGKLKDTGIRGILHRFQSLEHLYVMDNTIQTISLFNNVVSGDESTMQRLAISIRNVQEDDLKRFVSRIPHMRSLRALHLQITNKVVRSSLCVDLLEKAVLRNASLQLVNYSDGHATPCDDNLGVWLSLNRAGQGFLQNGSMMVPPSLWPLILERAGKISYYSVRDPWGRPSMTDTRVDAVYWLLREKFFL